MDLLAGFGRTAIILSALLAALAAGCGKMGDPLPPEANLPDSPAAVTLALGGDQLLVDWDEVANASSYRVYRATLLDGDCVGCPMEWSEPTLIEKPPLPLLVASGGQREHFRVTALDRRHREGRPSRLVSVAPPFLPEPAFTVAAADRGVKVSVSAYTWPATVTPIGYNLYTADGKLLGTLDPGGYPRTFTGLENDVEQLVELRGEGATPEGWRVEGFGGEASVIPADDISPAPLSGLIAIGETGRVYVRWESVASEPSGLVELERAAEDGEFKPLITVPAEAISHVDKNVEGGKRYRYRGRVVDAANNVSPFSRPVDARPF